MLVHPYKTFVGLGFACAALTVVAQQKPGAVTPVSVAKAEYRLTTVSLENGSVVTSRSTTLCIAPGAFTAFHHVGVDESDTDCKVQQAGKVPGDFFKVSCSNGSHQFTGSLRKLSEDGFSSSYVSSVSGKARSMGTAAVRSGDC